MKVLVHVVAFCALLTLGAQAQSLDFPPARHSLGIGVERVGLDAPDDIGNRYLVRYARQLLNDRLVIELNEGYMSILNEHYVAGDTYVYGKPRKRITSDLTVSFDVIRHPRHAFRLGVGPSLWYRQDELLLFQSHTINSQGEVTNVQLVWQPLIKQLNYGSNVLVEYEYALTGQLLVSGKLKFADMGKAGQSSIYGVGLGYRLP